MADNDAEEKALADVDTSDHDTIDKSDPDSDENQQVADKNEENEKEEETEDISKESDAEDKTENEDSEKLEEVELSKKGKEAVVRPIRERRKTDFYKDLSYAKSPAPKFSVQQGSGTKLKDIPNVAFMLSKRKPDDTLHSLHLLLFGKKGKNPTLKRNIGQFSGYVWAEDEEKQRVKLREKFNSCIKEKLLDFCDVLNISLNKKTTKKEDVINKLFEFLESPDATTERLLADKDQKAKTGKVTPSKPNPGEASTKKLKRTTEEETANDEPQKEQKGASRSKSVKKALTPTSRKRARGADAASGSSSKTKGPISKKQKLEKEANEGSTSKSVKKASDQTDEDEPPRKQKENMKSISKENKTGGSHSKSKSTHVKKESASKSVKKAPTPTSRKRAREADATSGSSSKAKGPVSKKQKNEKEAIEGSSKGSSSKAKVSVSKKQNTTKGGSSKGKEKTTVKKEPTKAPANKKAPAKDKGKGMGTKKPKPEPSREEIHAIVADMLKETDFNTVTISDVIRQLGTHFGMDLMHRKFEVKDIIGEVITNMTDEEDEEAQGEEAEKNAESGDEEESEEKGKFDDADEEEKGNSDTDKKDS